MDELRGFIYEAVNTGDLENTLESLSMVEPKFTAVSPEAVELTLRRGEAGMLRTFIDSANVGGRRRWMRSGTPPAKPSSRASKVRSGRGCTTSMWTCTKQSTLKKPITSKKTKALWST